MTLDMDEEQFKQVLADIRSLKEGQKSLKSEIDRLHKLAAADVNLIYKNMNLRDKIRGE